MKNEELIIICAIRYALGRMSYVVNEICNYVNLKKNELSENCIKVIIRDIEEELHRYHDMGELLGMECDEKDWLKLLSELKGVVND